MGRLLPSQIDRDRVRAAARAGVTEEDMAADFDMPLKRFQKLFKRELEQGDAEGRHNLLTKLYDIAETGENLNALLFWVKARCGWRDTGVTRAQSIFEWPQVSVEWNGK